MYFQKKMFVYFQKKGVGFCLDLFISHQSSQYSLGEPKTVLGISLYCNDARLLKFVHEEDERNKTMSKLKQFSTFLLNILCCNFKNVCLQDFIVKINLAYTRTCVYSHCTQRAKLILISKFTRTTYVSFESAVFEIEKLLFYLTINCTSNHIISFCLHKTVFELLQNKSEVSSNYYIYIYIYIFV